MIFIYGEEEYLVNLELKKVLHELAAVPTVFTEKDSVEDIIMDVTTVSIFDSSKTILVKNHEVFTDDKMAAYLVSEIQHDVNHINFICVLEEDKIKKTNPLIDFLLKNADVRRKDKLNPKEVVSTIKTIVANRNAEISNGAAIKLAAKLPLNLRIIINEVEKLILENINITEEMVDKSIGDYLNEDYFALTNAIISSDNRAIVAAYQEKLRAGETAQLIIGQVASILNLAMLVSSYKKQGLSTQDISETLNVHIFRIKKAQELINSAGSENIESLIISLAKLDKDIKTGIVDEEKGMDHFILQLIK